MTITTVEELDRLMERYEEVLFSREPDLDSLITDPNQFAERLLHYVEVWQKHVDCLESLIAQITQQMLLDRELTPLVAEIATSFELLLDDYEQVRRLLGPIELEDAHSELEAGMRWTVAQIEDLLRHFTPNRPPAFISAVTHSPQAPLYVAHSRIPAVKNLITKQQRNIKVRERRTRLRSSLFRNILGSPNQPRLVMAAFLTTLALKVARLPTIDALSERGPLRIAVLVITAILVLVSGVRLLKGRKRYRAFTRIVATLLAVGVVSLWASDRVEWAIVPLSQYTFLAKLFLSWMTILWFPSQFLNAFRNHRITSYVFAGMFWAALAAVWAYGVARGLAIAFLLLIWPAYRLLNTSKSELREFRRLLGKRLYIPSVVSLLLVALLVTREPIWLLGMAVWLTFIWITGLSYRHFRRTYDLIEELFPDARGRDRKNRFLLISLFLSMFLLTPGLLGQLDLNFVTSLYLQAAGLAFALITILLAVQAIIPGVTTWSREDSLSRRMREMRSILTANAGLEGFMQLFFLLFIYSLLGWLITTRFFTGISPVVDLTLSYHLNPRIDLLAPFREMSEIELIRGSTLVGLSTLFFAGFVSIAVYAIAQLYYLFIAANTLVLPIRDTLLSTPVQIEQCNASSDGMPDAALLAAQSEIVRQLTSNRKLNGYIIDSLDIELHVNEGAEVAIKLEMDYIEMERLLLVVREVYRSLFRVDEVQKTNLTVFQRVHIGEGKRDVFKLSLTLHQWREFLSKDIEGFPFRYKLQRLGAIILDYVAAESRLA